MKEKVLPSQPLQLNPVQQRALAEALGAFKQDHPYCDFDTQTGEVTFNLYDDEVTGVLTILGPLAATLSKGSVDFKEPLVVDDPEEVSNIHSATYIFLTAATQREIDDHDCGNPQRTEEYVGTLRDLYLDMVPASLVHHQALETTALALGIPTLIDYERIWEYARSDVEKEKDPVWALQHRQALHLLQLIANQEP